MERRLGPRQPEQPVTPDAHVPPRTEQPEQARPPLSGDLTPGEAVVLPRKTRTRRTTPLTPEAEMQQAEHHRKLRSEGMKRYYHKLKERVAQGDPHAEEVLEHIRNWKRKGAKQWREKHPERHKQNKKQWEQSERGRAYRRMYARNRYARKKEEQAQAE